MKKIISFILILAIAFTVGFFVGKRYMTNLLDQTKIEMEK